MRVSFLMALTKNTYLHFLLGNIIRQVCRDIFQYLHNKCDISRCGFRGFHHIDYAGVVLHTVLADSLYHTLYGIWRSEVEDAQRDRGGCDGKA